MKKNCIQQREERSEKIHQVLALCSILSALWVLIGYCLGCLAHDRFAAGGGNCWRRPALSSLLRFHPHCVIVRVGWGWCSQSHCRVSKSKMFVLHTRLSCKPGWNTEQSNKHDFINTDWCTASSPSQHSAPPKLAAPLCCDTPHCSEHPEVWDLGESVAELL